MDIYGVIGSPLGHSLSADYFTRKFARESTLDTKEYRKFELESITLLPELLAENPDLKGFNVTIPYKKQIIPYLDELSAEAERIGAVNCVKIVNGRLIGYNTDYAGFRVSLEKFLGDARPSALVLGTGGSSLAVQTVLKDLGITFLTVSRSAKRGNIAYKNLSKEHIIEHPLIINTTPLGMFPDVKSCPPIPYEFLSEEHFLYDLVYNPPTTEFLKRGQFRNTSVCNGQRMFIMQAEASWNIFGTL